MRSVGQATTRDPGMPDHGFTNGLIREISPSNFLSFGPDKSAVQLQSLNVLIGPNGSGKSNLIETLLLMRAAPEPPRGGEDDDRSIQGVIRRGGGTTEWIWKGSSDRVASVSAVFSNPAGKQPLRHTLAFEAEEFAFRLVDERVENEHAYRGQPNPYFYYKYQNGRPVLNTAGHERSLQRETIELDQSVLWQRRDPEAYPEVTYLASQYSRIRVYREWQFGRNTVFRRSQAATARNDRLAEDFSNLGLILNRLERNASAKNAILSNVRDLTLVQDRFAIVG